MVGKCSNCPILIKPVVFRLFIYNEQQDAPFESTSNFQENKTIYQATATDENYLLNLQAWS